ncbi:3-phosphoserine/phosphohydroxythreonine transaminase [Phaeodactylibacter luteus]|uniref:Phosphoserine aminotransferase n=1 Tax=Phaeodactylibacter luteus TaxID=1564516 RepID=A0A5C6RT86_9BACT|nr:3-phosphoserine/phosphohydroxythreonine transaminase [Phaeodactylibacter luteus]TXB65561.1 3-phosphoserine/phosphohydroxythreonine transaminase [Phaeodactylibacter luteus]
MKKHNFSAGPAILPQPVFEQAAEAVRDFNGMGLSLLEISHRSPQFTAVLDEAQVLVRDLLGLSDAYEVLFLQGGASSQFFMTAMNLLDEKGKGGYVDTGSWSAKAIKEAQAFGPVEVVASSKASNYNAIPKGYPIPDGLTYLHITTNNTIFGTQYKALPETATRLVADMSSDIFSKPVDTERFDLIYAGAQKNMGPAGVTLVIVRKDALGKVGRHIPTMLDYRTHIKKGSSFNTPPVFPIYVSMLTLRWVKANGGLKAMQARNEAKAKLMYEAIDSNPLFDGTVAAAEDRSVMNATFNLIEGREDLFAPFLELCEEAGCSGVKGHRSVGGFRASLYNAMDLESVQVLADVMHAFTEKYA